ncbi:hypothetical protein [Aeromonas caviae]|jgi:hypothetical protein|uniref:hypothetical protein n=1 Tax=Aeromonas caviae TaxID=648 RepID=UPI003859B239
MVFFINNGLCAANEQIIGMNWTDKVQFLVMEYEQQLDVGRFFIEFESLEEFYAVIDQPDYLSSIGLGKEYELAFRAMKMEVFLLMRM